MLLDSEKVEKWPGPKMGYCYEAAHSISELGLYRIAVIRILSRRNSEGFRAVFRTRITLT
jgi:hypothetical protein